MNIKHKYDHYGRKEPSPIFLAKPGKRIYCALSGIDESNVNITTKTNNTSELTFSIDKYVEGKLNKEYDMIDEYMELYCSGIWFKIMEPPTISNDGLRETKEVTAESYEIMLTQYTLKTFLINMGTEASYEMMYQKDHDTSKFYQVKFYDPNEEKLSLLHLILSHADVPGWKIGYVDYITPDDQGVFLPDSICNFEVDDKSVYAFLTQEVSAAYKCVFEFDTVNMLINVYRPDSFGKDTNVVIGFRNIQDNITITRDESLVTQFYVEGLDGYNIEMYNFKDNRISDLSWFCKEPYMNKTLQDKYNAWVNYRETRREEFADLSREYNSYLTKLTELMYRVPVDSAQNNWFGRKTEELKSAYDENVAIIRGLESLYVDENNNFDLDALKASHDWSLYESIMNYTLPSIVAALQAKKESVDGFGKGNVISCVNPVVMGDDWLYLGVDQATFDTITIDNAPAWGITRGVKVTGSGGIRQKNITVEKTQMYTLSCYVKGSGTFNLEYGDAGQERTIRSFNISSSTWQRVFTTFNPGSKLVDVAFTGSNFTVCGMQLEMGSNPSQFGYFIQSENIIKAYETDWKLYGISELKAKIATYEDCADELKKNGYAGEYNPLADYEEAYFTQMHQLYLDYLKLMQEAQAALNERQTEYDVVKEKQDAIDAKRDQIVKDVSMEYFGVIQTELEGFTPNEIYIIKSLYNQSTYTNENIIVTSLDDTVDAVDKQKKLYEEAIEQLYIESHPQFIYEDSINNIYALPEFKEFHDELQVNNFVRVGLDDRKYIKLRVTEISFNPMALDESMDITFSNMIQYRTRRDDFAEMINDAGNGSNRSGGRVSSVNKSATSEYVITADVIKQLFSNPLFGSIMGGTTAGGTASGGTITADKIIAELVKADEGIFGKLTADTAFIKYLESQLIVSDKIVTGILQADKATIEELAATLIEANEINADVANIKKLLAGSAGIGDLTTINLTAKNVVIDDAVIKDLIASKISVADLMTHSATAELITLIDVNGKPTIAFKNSTQQFYDSLGNVRVQIGQDGNGNFNFVVRGEDGTTALFDENGIHKEGIPNDTIINDMIEARTIDKDRLSFDIVEGDGDGNVDITHVMLDGKEFGTEYVSFRDNMTKQVTFIVDNLEGTIESKIQETVFNDKTNTINTSLSTIEQKVDGINQVVSEQLFESDGVTPVLESHKTQIKQTADKLSLIATGDSESNLTLTDKFISLISDTISINADNINIDGLIKAINTRVPGQGTTLIDGGQIEAESLKVNLITAGLLQSDNYVRSITNETHYADSGTKIDMTTGAIDSKNFAIDSSGNAYFRGNGEFEGSIIANSGFIGGSQGFHIESGKLYSGKNSFLSTTQGVYLGTDGISLGSKFKVDNQGNLTASNVTLSGSITATSGSIAGSLVTSGINANNITAGAIGAARINVDNLSAISSNLGNITGGSINIGNGNFYVGSNGILSATGATITGTIYADDGEFGGTLNAATGSFSGNITASSGKIGGFYITSNSLYNGENKLGGSGVYVSPTGISCGSVFKVDNQGYGEIAGFTATSVNNVSDHRYENTLYCIVTGTDGYDYQAGIKGKSSTGGADEAAFYIRRKLHTAPDWSNTYSTLPFYVRKDGYTYVKDISIGNSLYMYGSDWDDNAKKIKAMSTSFEFLRVGILNDINNSPYIEFENPDWQGGYGHVSICFNQKGNETDDLALTISGNKADGYELYSQHNVDLGNQYVPFKTLYVDAIELNGDRRTAWPGGSGSGTNYNAGTGISISNGTIAANTAYFDNNYAAKSHSHNYVSKNGGDVNGTLLMKNHRGYNCYDATGTDQTMVYITDNVTSGVEHNTAYFGNNRVPTIIRGKDKIQLGNNSTTVKIPYAPPSDATNYLVVDSDGNIGSRTSSGGGETTSYASLSDKPSINGHTLSGAMTLSGLGIQPAGSYALSSHTHSIKIDGTIRALNSFSGYDLCTVSNAKSMAGTPDTVRASDNEARPPITTGSGSSQKIAYITANNTTRLNVVAQFGSSTYSTMYVTLTTSDKRLKTNISSVNLDALSIINAINIRQFDWIADGKHQKVGMIADELELIDSDLVFGNGYDEDGNIDIKSINSFYLQGYEIKAIQELSKINERQSEKIQELTTTLLQLQGEISILKQKLEEIIC